MGKTRGPVGEFRRLCFFAGRLAFSRFPVGLLPFGTAKVGGLFGLASGGLRNKVCVGCKWLGLGEKIFSAS